MHEGSHQVLASLVRVKGRHTMIRLVKDRSRARFRDIQFRASVSARVRARVRSRFRARVRPRVRARARVRRLDLGLG